MPHKMTAPQAVGIVKLEFRDAKTMEIKRTIEQENAITLAGFWDVFMYGGSPGILGLGQTFGVTAEWIYVSPRISTDGLTTAPASIRQGSPVRATTNTQEWTYNVGPPDFSEKVNRFDPPGSPRTINTIYLSSDNNLMAFAIASLNTPCIQGTSEVLDITYRIQYFFQAQVPTELAVSSSFGEALARRVTRASEPDGGIPESYTYMWQGAPPIGPDYFGMVCDSISVQPQTNINVRKKFFKNEFAINETIATNNGRVIRTVGYGAFNANTFFESAELDRTTVWAPIAPDSFVNKPIQTIHNHAFDAPEWGLDVDFLSTGQGSLTLDGSSWTDPDYPQFYRIDHLITGQVGVSRYSFRKRPLIGFQGNTYESNRQAIVYNARTSPVGEAFEYSALVGAHGTNTFFDMEEYDHETMITWGLNIDDVDGITVTRFNDSNAVNFDSTTTPALNASDIRQVAVDLSGNIWVAAKTGGLFKITEPFDTPVITKMLEVTNTIVAGGEDSAYAVATGNNGDILALVEGGLIRTTNPNGATPLFSTETFTFTGISDANWSNVLYMRVDPESIEYELALVTEISFPSTPQSVVWWSTTQAAILGPVSSTFTYDGITTRSRYGRVNCSRRGSLWCRYGPSQNSDQINLLTFALNTFPDINTNTGAREIPHFFYDYYDTPLVAAANVSGSWGPWSPIDDKNFGGHDGAASASWGAFQGSFLTFQSPGGGGIYLNRDLTAQLDGENHRGPYGIKVIGPRAGEYMDALNGQYSPHEEIVWDRYGWNGAAWVKNFFVDATDTGTHAGGPYVGSRENFDVETHDFTGRSMIDITTAFAANNFAASANATFVFTLIPIAKLSIANNDSPSQQEKPRILLDLSDDTQQFQIVWDTDIQGNITIVEDGDGGTVIASTPANSGTYRLVVTIAGTAVNVFLDGATIGSTVTLANAFDWDNTGGDLIAFLGCGVYKFDYPQRNQPWQHNFYRGEMKNVQLWNVTWDGTDVTNDFVDITSVIGSKPAANLVARYELTQPLATLETRLSHVGAEALFDGITIAFVNGANPDAFIGGDYHTFGVVDGILKDNAIAFTQQFSIYYKPTDLSFDVFKNGSGTDTIEASTTAIVDERAIFTEIVNPAVDGVGTFTSPGFPNQEKRLHVAPGQLFQNQVMGFSQTTNFGAITVQSITGNGYFEGGPTHADEATTFGLTSTPSALHSSANINFSIRFNTNGDIDIVEANVVVQAVAATYVVGDIFRIERTGTAITYLKNGGLIFTSGTTSSGIIYGRVHLPEEGYGLRDAVITYTRPARILTVGDSGSLTGVFDPDYLVVETLTPESITINIGGSPATVVVSETYFDNMTTPGPGQVVVNGDIGWLVFHADDVGSAITGDVTVVFDKV